MEKYRAAGRLIVFRPCPAAGRLALFKQKRWFKTKTNNHVASRLETTISPVPPRFIRHVSSSPRVTSTRVKFKFDPLHHICVLMSNLHFMSFNVCLYATDLNLYLIVFTERDKNFVYFMQSRLFIELIFTFMHTCQGCA